MGPVHKLAVTLCLLATACGAPGPDPVTTEAPAAESALSPTPSPEPTDRLRSSVCYSVWDRAGEEFSYDPDEYTRSAAQVAYCGTQAPVAGTCPANRENLGAEYSYDPDETTRIAAQSEFCGPVVTPTPKPTPDLNPTECAIVLEASLLAWEWAEAGIEFTQAVTAWPENPQVRLDSPDLAWAFGEQANTLGAFAFSSTLGDAGLAEMAQAAADSHRVTAVFWTAVGADSETSVLVANLQLISSLEKMARFADAAERVYWEYC